MCRSQLAEVGGTLLCCGGHKLLGTRLGLTMPLWIAWVEVTLWQQAGWWHTTIFTTLECIHKTICHPVLPPLRFMHAASMHADYQCHFITRLPMMMWVESLRTDLWSWHYWHRRGGAELMLWINVMNNRNSWKTCRTIVMRSGAVKFVLILYKLSFDTFT